MTTQLLKSEFVTTQTPRFGATFTGEIGQRKDTVGSIMARRTMRRARRENRSL